jgi:hypothetical protein
MGFALCNCNKVNPNMQLPFTNLSLLDNKHNNDTKHNHIKNCDDLNQQSNNINDARKNININIININKEQISNPKKYSSNNGMSSDLNNNDTNKLIDPLNYGKGEIVEEESDVREGGEEEEEDEPEEQK